MVHNLVPSDRVERAPVCGRDGAAIGVIERLMLDKQSGKVAYAVIKCAERFPRPAQHYPLPWEALKYNPQYKAFEIDMSVDELRKNAQVAGEDFDWGDRAPGYRHPHYWTL